MEGGAGNDTFVFDFAVGYTYIYDFEHHIDIIDLTEYRNLIVNNFQTDFATPYLTEQMDGVHIDMPNSPHSDHIILLGLKLSDIDAGDFRFSA